MTLPGQLLYSGTLPRHRRRGDMNAYGHVNNVRYLRYAEEARVQNPGAQHARSSR